ncbi:MAG: ABC transporter ATP-binding protein [Planctomycetota bacterium]|jgi:lipoprotein-releasing system ATP-binding protein
MSKTKDVLLKAEGVNRDFKIEGGVLPVLKGVDLDVRRGEILSIVGKSGVGKSTLLHILGALDVPTSGIVVHNGRDLASLSPVERAEVRNRHFGFTFQFYHLLPEFNALENIMLPAMIGRGLLGWMRERRNIRKRAAELLSEMGLEERGKHRPSQLSGGERQRVAIARSMINEPEILFCDEPTGNLDSKTGAEIIEMLWRLNLDRGQTLVLVTHDDSLAKETDRIARMVDGKVVETRNARKGKN